MVIQLQPGTHQCSRLSSVSLVFVEEMMPETKQGTLREISVHQSLELQQKPGMQWQ